MFRRKRRYPRDDTLPGVAVAFGAGLILACFVSLKLALFLAAVALVCLGLNCRR